MLMALNVEIWQTNKAFGRLLKINKSRNESLGATINFLLELGIDVYLLEENILEEI